MPWWGWMIIGAILLVAELFGVDAAFYLMFIGFAAILTGLLGMSGLEMAPWLQWLVFAGVAFVSMILFRKRLYKKLREVSVEYNDGRSGDIFTLSETLEPGNSCRMAHSGSTWTVLNRTDSTLASGTSVQVIEVKGLTLMVRAYTGG